MNDEKPPEAPFAFGEGTLMQLREQRWEFDESATQVITPGVTSAVELVAPHVLPVTEDPLVRIEQKLDALKRRLDSIDAALARVLTRS